MDLSAESVLSGLDQFLLMEKQWHYRGEGNSKIAISLPAEKKVVLLLKSSKNETPGDIETWRCMKDNIAFVSSVMRSLLGQTFVSCSTLIYLCSDDIETLNKKLAGVRPENRLHKVLFFRGAEYCNDYTFLPKEMSELCQSKSVCVEIKPKQGIFPSSDIKNRNCLFCCKQQLKLKDGLTTQRSKYCPLDLFSGCRLRIKRALKSLLDSPQNNLRIFCDGNLVFGEGNSIKDLKEFLSQWLHPVTDSDIVERFTSMLLQALMKDMRCLPALSQDLPKEWIYDGLPEFFPSKKTSVASVQFQNNNLPPCDFGRRDSPEGSILHALALAQSLDQWGLSEVLDKVPIYYNHPNQSQENITTGYVFDVIEKGCTSKLNPIELYLIAAVVRDCSAFITFQEMQQNFNRTCSLPKVEETYSKTCYLLKISVADINPKRFSVIYSHASRNYKILEAIKSQ